MDYGYKSPNGGHRTSGVFHVTNFWREERGSLVVNPPTKWPQKEAGYQFLQMVKLLILKLIALKDKTKHNGKKLLEKLGLGMEHLTFWDETKHDKSTHFFKSLSWNRFFFNCDENRSLCQINKESKCFVHTIFGYFGNLTYGKDRFAFFIHSFCCKNGWICTEGAVKRMSGMRQHVNSWWWSLWP